MQATSAQILNWQLLLIVGLPTITVLCSMLFSFSNNNATNQNLIQLRNELGQLRTEVSGKLDMLTGKVAELSDRVTHIEARLHM